MCMPLDTINTSLVLKVKIPLLPNNLPGAIGKYFLNFLSQFFCLCNVLLHVQ